MVTRQVVKKDEKGQETVLDLGALAENVEESDTRKFVTGEEKTQIAEIPELKKSVSDGKSKIAAAITDKGVETAATDTFDTMAGNIGKIRAGGGGTATPADVLEGKTIMDAEGVERPGEIPNRHIQDPEIGGIEGYPDMPVHMGTAGQIRTTLGSKQQVYMLSPKKGYYQGDGTDYTAVLLEALRTTIGYTDASKVLEKVTIAGLKGAMKDWTATPSEIKAYRLGTNRLEVAVQKGYHHEKWADNSYEYLAFATLANLIGLTAAKLWPGNTVIGITSNKQSMAGQTITPSKSQQTVSCNGKAMTGNIVVNAIPSSYVDTSGNPDLFKNGSFGSMAGGAKQLQKPVASSNNYGILEFVGIADNRLRWYARARKAGDGRPSTGYLSQTPVWIKKKILLTDYKTLEMSFCSDTLGGRGASLRISPRLLFSQTPVSGNSQGSEYLEPSKRKSYTTDTAWKDYTSKYVDLKYAYNGDNSLPKVQFDVSQKTGWWYIGFRLSLQYGASDFFLNINEEIDIIYITLKRTAVGQ